MFRVEPLDKAHDRESFDCGDEALNTFIRKYAGQQQRRFLSRVYVALDTDNRMAGFYTLSTASVEFDAAPDALKRHLAPYPIPAALIGRLAVDRRYRGQGAGRHLLAHALTNVRRVAAIAGVAAVVVDAKNAEAATFYQRFGFMPFSDGGMRLFYPVSALTPPH